MKRAPIRGFASKPAPFLATFSRDFVSRLRHRAGTVRRETRREGCVRDKQEAQKPTIAPGSGFQPPHSRLERKKNNRKPACPEVVPAKATCGWFWYFCHQKYRESRDDVAGVLYLFSAKRTDRSLRLVLFAAFWSAKSGAKTDPPTKKAERRGLTLAPGDYSRVCKQTVPSARAFSPPLS